MNFLIAIKLIGAICYTVIGDNQDSYEQFELALNSVESQITIEHVDFYHTDYAVGSSVPGWDNYNIKGVVFTCNKGE